ncbi:peptidase associated/transthyretin-like domain-containing protein [Horticoccus sp. 23ND18S-11]|uniref:hypothetical protein n=1 Tax=Horticoccus sp. 23ND18S-11 TaxID=3391832 RepID=UPI0039C96454
MKPLFRSIFAALGSLCIVASSAATDLRGRVDGLHRYSPTAFPVARMQVAIWTAVAPPAQPRLVASATTGQDGMYALRGIAPGSYVIIANNLRYPITVRPGQWQDIPPILIRY